MTDRDIRNIEFTIFDLETTGLGPELGDRIVEIAAVRFKNGQQLGVFHSLLNPGDRVISPEAFLVNRINQEMLVGAPGIEKILPEFLSFISESCLAAYNAPFDVSFLSAELKRINLKFPCDLQIIDLLAMARRMLPGKEKYTLSAIAPFLGIHQTQEHRALSDVQMTVEVFKKLILIMAEKRITDFNQCISLFGLRTDLWEHITNTKVARIQEALGLGVSLKIIYLTRHNAECTEREVIPKALIQRKNQSYLVGFCKLRNEERTFGVSNILHVEIAEVKPSQ